MRIRWKREYSTKNIYKKTQKGRLPFFKKKGIYLNEGKIGLFFNTSWFLTSLQLKAIKASITFHIPKYILKYWRITPIISRCKRQGTRMGKGKSKINSFGHFYPKNSILLELNILFSNDFIYSNIYKDIYLYNTIISKLSKILLKYPFLYIKSYKSH